jgi:hypothetical protein
LDAAPCTVRATVGNSEYLKLWKEFGPPVSEAQLDEWFTRYGAHVVGIGFEQSVGGLGGHLIALVDGRTVVDASLDQAASSSHGLAIPPVVVFDPDPRGLPLGILRSPGSSLFIEYYMHPAIADHLASPDWGNTRQVRDAAERIHDLITNAA